MTTYSSKTDGKDHINVYSKGKTKLGRNLSNFAKFPIRTDDGSFYSIEGYWYWLLTQHEALRKMWGWNAKMLGRELLEDKDREWCDSDVFKSKILHAIEIKIDTYPVISDQFYDSTLPFTHYYEYYGKVVIPEGGEWIVEFLEKKRCPNGQ